MSTPRETFLSDVITTALEGGIGYWAVADEYEWSDEKPATTYAVIRDEENEEGESFRIDGAAIARALGILRAGAVRHLHAQDRIAILAASEENDAGEIDATWADVLVQVACFGQVVYG